MVFMTKKMMIYYGCFFCISNNRSPPRETYNADRHGPTHNPLQVPCPWSHDRLPSWSLHSWRVPPTLLSHVSLPVRLLLGTDHYFIVGDRVLFPFGIDHYFFVEDRSLVYCWGQNIISFGDRSLFLCWGEIIILLLGTEYYFFLG